MIIYKITHNLSCWSWFVVAETIDHVIPGMMHNHELVTAQVPVMETLPDGTQHEVVQTYHTNQHQHHELVADLARRSCWWSASATYGNVEHRRKPVTGRKGKLVCKCMTPNWTTSPRRQTFCCDLLHFVIQKVTVDYVKKCWDTNAYNVENILIRDFSTCGIFFCWKKHTKKWHVPLGVHHFINFGRIIAKNSALES